MSMKKFFATILCTTFVSISMNSVSANVLTTMDPLSIQSNKTTDLLPIYESNYTSMIPKQLDSNYVSVSGYTYSFKASLMQTGEVEVILHIDQKHGSLLGYFEHLATDADGYYLTPEKNTIYSINEAGDYRIVLAADSISSDGYIFMKSSLFLAGADTSMSPKYYKIPIDYDQHKTNNENKVKLNGNHLINISTMYENISASSKKLSNGDAEISIKINEGNTYGLMFQLQAVSEDGMIYIPSKNRDQFINTTDGTTNTFIISADQIPTTNILYFDIFIDLRSEMKLADRVYIEL